MADNIVKNLLIDRSTSTLTLKKALDAQALRQRAHAQNIANAETPGYQRVAVEFEEQLKDALSDDKAGELRRSDPRHLGESGPGALGDLLAVARAEAVNPDGPGANSVDIDREMAEMAETQLRYMASLELLKRRYAGLKSAIKGQ